MKRFLLIIIISLLIGACKGKVEITLAKYPNGQIKELLVLDKPVTIDSTGIEKVFFENGKLQCFGPVTKNKRNGLWTCYYPNDSIEWIATYKMEIETGEIFCRNQNGTWKKMLLKDGVKEGKTTEYNYDETTKEHFYIKGQYSNNLEEGLWTKTDTSGTLLIEMTFIKGERIGFFTNRYKNGQIRLKGELQKNGSMINFTYFDETGKETKRDGYTIERI